jgi:hypothetical protein
MASLDETDGRPVKSAMVRERFLAQTSLGTQLPHSLPEG